MLGLVISFCSSLSCYPLPTSRVDIAMPLLGSGIALNSFATSKCPHAILALVPANLSQAASKVIQNELYPHVGNQILRILSRNVETEARQKLSTYTLPKYIKKALEVYLNPEYRSKARMINKFSAPVASVPPQTLDLLLLAGDFCIVNPKPCKTNAEKEIAVYAIKVAKQSRDSDPYRRDCEYYYIGSQSEGLRLRRLSSNTKDACRMIDLLSKN